MNILFSILMGFGLAVFALTGAFLAYQVNKVVGRRETALKGDTGLRLTNRTARNPHGRLVNFKSIEEAR